MVRDARLGREMEGERNQPEGLVEVHVAEGPFEADILLSALEREGIRGVCRKHEEIAYDGLFVLQRGWGAILVPGPEATRAKEIIRDAMEIYGVTQPR